MRTWSGRRESRTLVINGTWSGIHVFVYLRNIIEVILSKPYLAGFHGTPFDRHCGLSFDDSSQAVRLFLALFMSLAGLIIIDVVVTHCDLFLTFILFLVSLKIWISNYIFLSVQVVICEFLLVEVGLLLIERCLMLIVGKVLVTVILTTLLGAFFLILLEVSVVLIFFSLVDVLLAILV